MLNFTARDRQRFEDVYKALTTVAEAYFLSSNRASNITTLKTKVLSANF